VPNRPALAIKVENLPAARPQTGLSWADVVFEEPVEAGITRFIAVYQCSDASRVEPVRSARLTDPDILVQFGEPLFGYAGGVPEVIQKIHRMGLVDLSDSSNAAARAYRRDPARTAPHDLYTSTQGLYHAVSMEGRFAPDPVFTYSEGRPSDARSVAEVHLPFSQYSDVYWRWSSSRKAWLRWHGVVPHQLSDGTQVSATNVVIQMVRVKNTDIKDVNGVPSPEVVAIGSGKCYVLRNGRMVTGTWKRPDLGSITKYYGPDGEEIPLMRGNTWVELYPNTLTVTAS